MQTKDQQIIEIWNRLSGMWLHHQDGSDFCPVTKREMELKGNPEKKDLFEFYQSQSNESKCFDVVFNELYHMFKECVDPENRDKIKIL